MKKYFTLLSVLVFVNQFSFAQTYPVFGNEIPVTINGLTFDAMEPSISADAHYLFFNSLNNGSTTALYYATKINDSTFNYAGALTGADQTTPPYLDAVASSDSANNFYWTSTRNFPTQFDNYFHGTFNGTDVVNIGRVHGTFYIYSTGWIMMDASINYSGNLLYYTNAYFGPTYAGCGIPCEAKLGVAQKLNDSTFSKLSNSDGIMQNINDTNYVVYAPNISNNGLELYYTRVLKSNLAQGTEICVSFRTNLTDTFSLPSVFYPASTLTPEATTLTSDQLEIYYHKKEGGLFKIFLRYRIVTTGINEHSFENSFPIYPTPANETLNISIPDNQKQQIQIFNAMGMLLKEISASQSFQIDISNLPSGLYFIHLKSKASQTQRFVRQ